MASRARSARHRRIRPGDRAQRAIRTDLQQPRRRLRRQGQARPRHRGLRPGGQAQQQLRTAFYNRGNAKYDKGDYAQAIADYDSALKLNPADTLGAQQPWQRLCQPARLRPRHRRPDPGDQLPAGLCAGLDRPRRRLRRQGRARPRARRLRPGDQGRRPQQPGLLQPRPGLSRQGPARPRHRDFTRRSRSTRTTPPPTTIAAMPTN